MFKENFIKLCNQKKESPSFVCKKVGITPATFSGWNENSIPRRATLQRIADYFGVSIDYLLRETEGQEPLLFLDAPDVRPDDALDAYEQKLIQMFRQTSIDGKIRILNTVEQITLEIEKKAGGEDPNYHRLA